MITTKVERITPKYAEELLLRNKSNRPFSLVHARDLSNIIVRGEWITNTDAIGVSDEGNLLNGQHRLNAILLSDTPVDILVTRNLSQNAFKTIDQSIKVRTGKDALAVIGRKYTNALSATLTLLYKYINSNEFLDYSQKRVTPTMVLEMDKKYLDVADMVSKYKVEIGKVIRPSVGLFCMYVTKCTKIGNNMHEDFWNGLISGINLTEGDARLALRDRLMEIKANSGTHLHPVGPILLARLVFYGWNKFVSGEHLTYLRTSSIAWSRKGVIGDTLRKQVD